MLVRLFVSLFAWLLHVHRPVCSCLSAFAGAGLLKATIGALVITYTILCLVGSLLIISIV